MSFGGLAAGLGVGTMAEAARRGLGLTSKSEEAQTLDSLFLTPANAQRIVDTLCKVRGTSQSCIIVSVPISLLPLALLNSIVLKVLL